MGISSFRKIALLVAAACCLAAATPEPAGVPHFAEVNEHVFRGGQPSDKGFQSLATVGVRAIVDLRSPGSRARREEKLVEAAGMKYYNVPLPALNAPSDGQVRVILAFMSDSNNWPVFVHCQLGKDRTGTIIACYRIAHDKWPNARALAEAIDHGMNFTEPAMKSYIRRYQPDQPGAQQVILKADPLPR